MKNTISIKFDEFDYRTFEIKAERGVFFGEQEHTMKPAATNLPASCYLEFSNGFLISIVSDPCGNVTFHPVKSITEVSGIFGFFQIKSKGEISFDTDARWVIVWNKYPGSREELLRKIEEIALEEMRVKTIEDEDIESAFISLFLLKAKKHWESSKHAD